jgi:predicted nucleic acid-binding protein
LPSLFADTAYYVALMSKRDALNARALQLVAELKATRHLTLVTTDAVFVEVLTRASKFGRESRLVAADPIERTARDPRVMVLQQSGSLFEAGLALYRRRLEKAYSMIDCMSMVVCRSQRIREVLTADHDFEQEGFTILM